MGERDLDGFRIELLGKINSLLNGFARFTGQADNEVAVNANTDFAAVLHEGAGHFYRRALLDVLQNLRIAGFESHDEQSRASIGHGFQRVVIAMHARSGRPLEFQWLKLGAKVQDTVLADVGGVVIEKNIFLLWEIFDGLFY